MAYLCKPRVRSMRLLRGPSLCVGNVFPLVHTPPWRWAPSLSGYRSGCALVQSRSDQPGGLLLADRRTESVLNAPGHALDEALHVRLREGAPDRPETKAHGERLLPCAELRSPVEVEKGDRVEIPACRLADLPLDIRVRRGVVDHDSEIAEGRGIPRRRGHSSSGRRFVPRREIDLGDIGLLRQLPLFRDTRIELSGDQTGTASASKREPAART